MQFLPSSTPLKASAHAQPKASCLPPRLPAGTSVGNAEAREALPCRKTCCHDAAPPSAQHIRSEPRPNVSSPWNNHVPPLPPPSCPCTHVACLFSSPFAQLLVSSICCQKTPRTGPQERDPKNGTPRTAPNTHSLFLASQASSAHVRRD
ncbi:hypothetical protein CDD82_599 [Ophiocordyceps australis]|uniref:Uncharacterized protein n=1 Tax=Ophiocordyceps australis TaxID=1399860 RepID=A0A2C5YLK6_9HYPO|nr:hypothetical protein CDD82_599 [Ophiocordyceps australis]